MAGGLAEITGGAAAGEAAAGELLVAGEAATAGALVGLAAWVAGALVAAAPLVVGAVDAPPHAVSTTAPASPTAAVSSVRRDQRLGIVFVSMRLSFLACWDVYVVGWPTAATPSTTSTTWGSRGRPRCSTSSA